MGSVWSCTRRAKRSHLALVAALTATVIAALALSLFRHHGFNGDCDYLPTRPSGFQGPGPNSNANATARILEELHTAVQTMQDEYFRVWLGKWPDAIDWTAAVMGTHLSASLDSLSRSLSYAVPSTTPKHGAHVEAQLVENEINKYFSQIVTYYFGENHFALRNEAYDDMLWVVLDWLENIRFVRSHDSRHYGAGARGGTATARWHGTQFEPAFAHRARVFYEIARRGWDWKLCGGGMTWSQHALPYKNAITNELFIAASASMYLHFPGDTNCSPFMSFRDGTNSTDAKALAAEGDGDVKACAKNPHSQLPYDPTYLHAAINGYDWLRNVNMTNSHGLFVDGYHIKDFGTNDTAGTEQCDERNEMVFTYNQGVLLSGLRALWEATGNLTYLEDGHALVRNVLRATGWNQTNLSPAISFHDEQLNKLVLSHAPLVLDTANAPADSAKWSGLGSAGILTELCDPYGTCSQDGQTFKGIFFHHLTLFCSPLPLEPTAPKFTFAASKDVAILHRHSCKEYAAWVSHNALAALRTRDPKGRFGAWWGVSYDEFTDVAKRSLRVSLEILPPTYEDLLPQGAIDYRSLKPRGGWDTPEILPHRLRTPRQRARETDHMMTVEDGRNVGAGFGHMDPNDRGRGRTVETQSGGLAVVRAMWEFASMLGDPE